MLQLEGIILWNIITFWKNTLRVNTKLTSDQIYNTSTKNMQHSNIIRGHCFHQGLCSYPSNLTLLTLLAIMAVPWTCTVYPKKYAHGFCFAVLCCGYTLTDFPISIRLTSLALWQSKDCPSASKATLMNMDKYFMWIYYERLHNHNKAKHNKTVCIFLGICCIQRQ